MLHNYCRMNQPLKCFVALLLAAFFAMSEGADARSISDFIKAVGNSIAHPHPHTRARTSERRDNSKQTPPKDAAGPTAAVSPSPSPAELTVRPASAAPEAKGPKRDVPYGIPLPNKEGFVTSPYAPNQGLVDVRGFSRGTEVKDPYTGKIFLTP